MKLTFLEAAVPLTKSYSLSKSGELQKTSYPLVKNFTSHEEEYSSLSEFYKLVVAHAKQNHCLLKGNVRAALNNEPRAGSTISDASTLWICLDFDKAPFKDVEDALEKLHIKDQVSPFRDVSYIVQYSASHGLPGTVGLNCHVFIQLSHPVHAPYLKAWLMYLNLRCESLRSGIKLGSSNAALSWPLDITTCQNDKLLFIAPPVLNGIKDPLKNRIQLVPKALQQLPIERIAKVDLDTMRNAAHTLKNELRVAAGYDKLRNVTKYEAGYYTISKPGRSVITSDIREANGFATFNVNGGDSWSYYHPVDNYEYIYCFKHQEERFVTKDFLPDYWEAKEKERIERNAAPTEDGDILLAFSDFKSSSYWRGLWSPRTHNLSIAQVGNASMLNDWLMSYGRDKLDFVPPWNIIFDPTKDFVVDVDRKIVNTYVPNKFMRNTYAPNSKARYTKCPTIIKTILHVLNCDETSEEFEHFMNWLAVIYQKRIKTQTAWVLSGTEGTGKGTLGNKILAPTLGHEYVASRLGNSLEEIYNGWMERCIVAVLDEVDLAASDKKNVIHQSMRKYITDSPMPYRHMHRMSYEADSFINFILCTNSKESIHITEGNRRYNIGKYQPEKLQFGQADLDMIEKELPHWVNYIMTRDADVDKAAQIIKTEAHMQLVEVSRTSVDDVATRIMRGDMMYFLGFMPDLELQAELHGLGNGIADHYADIISREVTALRNHGTDTSSLTVQEKAALTKQGIKVGKNDRILRSRISRDELYTLFEYTVGNMPSTPAKFTQFLRHRDIHVEPVKLNNKLVRGMYVMWLVPSTKLDELDEWLAAHTKPAATGKVVQLKAKVN